MELRMNHSEEEFEEVESPFASRSPKSSSPRERLRTRKNVFNRPFATEPTHAPLLVETTATRKAFRAPEETELVQRRQSALAETEIDYLEEEEAEEEVAKRPARTTPKKKEKANKNLLAKAAWAVIGLLVLRLIFMDRGVWDYFAAEGEIRNKKDELASIRKENVELKNEIQKIQHDPNFQRSLAKEHLGVIAADEFLILFAGENAEGNTPEDPASDNIL